MIGYIDKNTPLSFYQPSQEIANFTAKVQKDYALGTEILNKPWPELNNRSVIEDENRGQMMFNAFVDESVENPHDAWKWKGTRSMARNKGIAMHANLTAGFLLPLFTAQNEEDEVDLDFSEVMRDIVEWMALPTNSDYQSSFLQMVFAMETNPVTYLGAEYCKVYQTIREKTKKGYTKKEILDEVLSGFKAPIWSSSQVLITNAFERNIQKQRCIIKRRYVEKSELEAKWGDHLNWDAVQTGVRSIYSQEDGLFYDVKDDEHPNLVAEETYLDRRNDTETTYLGGVYMGNLENVENNPIKHRDNRNAPKYNITPFGFHRIGDHFFFYKSMMNSLGWDNMLYDAMSEVVMNGAFLEVESPIAVSGSDKIDSEMIFPNAVIAFEDKDTRITPLIGNRNLVAGFNALRETEKSITEGSVNETISGQLPEASQKAYSVAQAQANAKKLIGAVGKSLAESVVQYGDLMKDIAINHYTIPEVEELVGGAMKLKYRNFALEKKNQEGKSSNKRIYFDEALIGAQISEEEEKEYNFKLLEESGYPEKDDALILVNPRLFAKFKFLTRVDTEEMFVKNQEYWQAILTNLYGMLRADPLVKADGLLRRLLYSYFQSDANSLIQEQPVGLPEMNGKQPQNLLGQMIQGKQLAGASVDALIQ